MQGSLLLKGQQIVHTVHRLPYFLMTLSLPFLGQLAGVWGRLDHTSLH
jgi:hypothetical protein